MLKTKDIKIITLKNLLELMGKPNTSSVHKRMAQLCQNMHVSRCVIHAYFDKVETSLYGWMGYDFQVTEVPIEYVEQYECLKLLKMQRLHQDRTCYNNFIVK
jgi:hypothetical protein